MYLMIFKPHKNFIAICNICHITTVTACSYVNLTLNSPATLERHVEVHDMTPHPVTVH